MQSIKQMLFTGWNIMRWVRLILGLVIAVQALQQRDSLSGLIAAVLLFQAVTNTGCCGAQGCSVPVKRSVNNKVEDTVFEEIK
jgi:hypothetical protein